MKIRIKGNSIRFRLTQTEVAKFCEHGYIREETKFDEKTFGYSLQVTEDVQNLQATFSEDTIGLSVPLSFSKNWANNEEVGIKNVQLMADGTELFLLLEKDFVCLDETFEDQSDNYPNPRAQ